MGTVTLATQTAPSTPSSGNIIIYSKSDGLLYWKDSGGTEYSVSTANPPFTDTNPLVKGSSDPTKLIRFEVDGLSAGATRVLTVSNLDFTLGKSPTKTLLSTSGTSTATYTTPAGCIRLDIRMLGAGGGGGASATNDGTVGANSVFGTMTCTGGTGGGNGAANGGSGGLGGAASNGDFNVTGNRGCVGAKDTGNPSGGHGAGGVFGGSGSGGIFGAAGVGATGFGSGGGGGAGSVATLNAAGGGGAGGYLEKRITSPAATYTYIVGVKGVGGAAGTNAGGDGFGGVILIDEYYG